MRVSGENRAPPGSRPYAGQSPGDWGLGAGDWRLTNSNSVSMDLFRDGLAQVLEFSVAAEAKDALDDASLPVEEHGVRQPPVMIDRFHAAATHENRERRPKLRDERAHLAIADIVGDCRDVEVVASKHAIQLRHMGKLGAARLAPGRPEIHERDLAAIIVEPDRLAGEVG